MILESTMMVFGMRVQVSRCAGAGGYTAELVFEGGDRAVVDAASLEELETLIDAVAYPAVIARCRSQGGQPGSAAG